MSLEPPRTFQTLVVKSAAWYGATRLWSQLLSWAVTILLARLLAPDDYGLFAVALSVLALLELLQEFGLGTAIVQRQDITRQQINTVFWLVTGASVFLTIVTFAGAEYISRFYADPRLSWVLRVLSLNFLFNSVGMVPYNLLTKAINLRHRSLADALATTASALLSLALAFLGYGVWALVLGHLARAVILNVTLGLLAGWVPGLELAFAGMRSVVMFGLRTTSGQLIGYLGPTVNILILARLLGGPAVGLYAMAQSLAEAPHRISTAVINQVSFPVFSKLQDRRSELAVSFLKISKYLAVVSLPIQIGLVVVAPDLIPLLLSSKWLDIVVPFQIFCLESAVVVLTLTSSPLLTARGRASLLLKLALLSFGTLTTASLIGAPFGLVGVAAARLVLMVPLRLTLLVPSLRELDVPMTAYLANLTWPMVGTAIMAATVVLVRQPLSSWGGLSEQLAVSVGTGALIYPAALLLLDRGFGAEVKTMARDLFSASRA